MGNPWKIDDEYEMTMDMPITDEQLALIRDDELEHTERIFFRTPKGKTVVFEKRETAELIILDGGTNTCACGQCGHVTRSPGRYCSNCGRRFEGERWR